MAGQEFPIFFDLLPFWGPVHQFRQLPLVPGSCPNLLSDESLFPNDFKSAASQFPEPRNWEFRTDMYLDMFSDSVGIKVRGDSKKGGKKSSKEKSSKTLPVDASFALDRTSKKIRLESGYEPTNSNPSVSTPSSASSSSSTSTVSSVSASVAGGDATNIPSEWHASEVEIKIRDMESLSSAISKEQSLSPITSDASASSICSIQTVSSEPWNKIVKEKISETLPVRDQVAVSNGMSVGKNKNLDSSSPSTDGIVENDVDPSVSSTSDASTSTTRIHIFDVYHLELVALTVRRTIFNCLSSRFSKSPLSSWTMSDDCRSFLNDALQSSGLLSSSPVVHIVEKSRYQYYMMNGTASVVVEHALMKVYRVHIPLHPTGEIFSSLNSFVEGLKTSSDSADPRNLVSLFTCSSVCVEGHGKPHVESVGARLQEALSRKQSTESSRFSFVGGYPAFLKQLPAKMT